MEQDDQKTSSVLYSANRCSFSANGCSEKRSAVQTEGQMLSPALPLAQNTESKVDLFFNNTYMALF